MGLKLLVRKPRVPLEAFCREFYDRYVLAPTVRGLNVGEVYCHSVQESIAEVDSGFATIDSERLLAEMTMVRFEVFGLAWLHQFGDKRAPDQSAYTKEYLVEKGHEDIWANMEPYNQAIARSSWAGYTSETATGRAYLTFFNTVLADSFDKWFARGFEPDCVARAANRLLAKAAWKKGITPGFVMLTLCNRLGYELNEQGQIRLAATIQGLYDGAREAMRQVKICVVTS